MSGSVFDRLLNWIDADPQTASHSYETIRQKLVIFFEGRQCGYCADELADRVFDIVLQKLEAGDGLAAPSPNAYLYGVARNVLREQWKRPAAESLPTNEHSLRISDTESAGRSQQRRIKDVWDQDRRQQEIRTKEQRRLDCLDRCLAELPSDTRELILEYYREEKRARIESRHRLASSLNITLNSLAIRVHRIRVELENSVSRCLASDMFS